MLDRPLDCVVVAFVLEEGIPVVPVGSFHANPLAGRAG